MIADVLYHSVYHGGWAAKLRQQSELARLFLRAVLTMNQASSAVTAALPLDPEFATEETNRDRHECLTRGPQLLRRTRHQFDIFINI